MSSPMSAAVPRYLVGFCFFRIQNTFRRGCVFSLLASWLLGFLASCWFMRRLVALAFRVLCMPSSSPGFSTFSPSSILSITSSSLFKSSLLRTSWGGLPPRPQPPRYFWVSTEIWLHPYLNHHFVEHHGGGGLRCPPQPPRYLLDVFCFYRD